MKRLAVTATVLGACGGKPPPMHPEHDAPDLSRHVDAGTGGNPDLTMPDPPAGFATADLVTVRNGELAAYAIVDGKLRQTGTTTLIKVDTDDAGESRFVDNVGNGGWADRDHLFLTTGERSVVMVTATAVTQVAIPAHDKFQTPKPAGDDVVAGGTGGVSGTGLVISGGAAWWSECPWGLPYDGFQCESYAHGRLWPTPELDAGVTALPRDGFAWPTAVPAGYTTRSIKRGDIDDAGIACQPPKNAGSRVNLYPNTDSAEMIDSYHWVSSEPPRLLVIYGHGGMSELIPDRWTLHAGCDATPLAGGSSVETGPAGLWLARIGDDTTTRQTIYRGAAPIGDLPTDASVIFRPSP